MKTELKTAKMEGKNARYIRTPVSRNGELAGDATPLSTALSPEQGDMQPGHCADTGSLKQIVNTSDFEL
jgi:hypothetical protein